MNELSSLFLENCDFSALKKDALKSLVNLKTLVVIRPQKCSHICLEHLGQLKWLGIKNIKHDDDLPQFKNFNADFNVLDVSNSRDLSSNRLEEIFKSCNFVKLKAFRFHGHLEDDFNMNWLNKQPDSILEFLYLNGLNSLKGSFSNFLNLKLLDLSESKNFKFQVGVFIGLDNLKSLNLSKMSLRDLNNGLFKGLGNLKKLNLSQNEINSESIEKTAFFDLLNLNHLDLSNNQLSKIEPDMFSGMPNLAELNLSHNSLCHIEKNGFASLKLLKSLNLSDCCIFTLEKEIFVNFTCLEDLDLSRNEMSIDVGQFRGYKGLENLKRLLIQSDRIPCRVKRF